MLNINNLYDEFEKKKKGRFETYKDILLKCHRKIKLSASNLQTETYFKVPDYIFGKPLYDVNACTYYIISKLTQNGFFATYVGNHVIFISWKNHNKPSIHNSSTNQHFESTQYMNKSSSYYKEKNNQLLDDDIKNINFDMNSKIYSRNLPIDIQNKKEEKEIDILSKLKEKYKF